VQYVKGLDLAPREVEEARRRYGELLQKDKGVQRAAALNSSTQQQHWHWLWWAAGEKLVLRGTLTAQQQRRAVTHLQNSSNHSTYSRWSSPSASQHALWSAAGGRSAETSHSSVVACTAGSSSVAVALGADAASCYEGPAVACRRHLTSALCLLAVCFHCLLCRL
jgi:hypothetical protein